VYLRVLDSRWEERARDGPIRCIVVQFLTKFGAGSKKQQKNQENKEGTVITGEAAGEVLITEATQREW